MSDFTKVDDIKSKWDGCKILDKWSSIYCANMLYTKLSSLGLSKDFKKELLESVLAKKEIQDEIQKTEHNRWNTERLLLGFAPLTKEEQDAFIPIVNDKKQLKDKKKLMAKEEMKHLDICSNAKLSKVDPYVVGYDNDLNSKLWELRQLYLSSNS